MKTSAILVWAWMLVVTQAAPVVLERVLHNGIQPQVAVASDGTVHLIYFTGTAGAGDVFYARRSATESGWSEPIRVNSQAGSAIAAGTIRGAQLALGLGGRVHVAWNGSGGALPAPAAGGSPMLYARLRDDGSGFESQRNLITQTRHLDGGGSLAAGTDGQVWVIWHAADLVHEGETNRAVYLAWSRDDGATFAPERPISPAGMGACGCCGLSAGVGPDGAISVLFRSARTKSQRDMTLLTSRNAGEGFREVFADRWLGDQCPMSRGTLFADRTSSLAAWETAGRIRWTMLGDKEKTPTIREVDGRSGAKHPFAARNERGETLITWTEGTGWKRGGSLAWQVFDSKGKALSSAERREGIPVWSYSTAWARPDGSFVILY